MVLIVRPPFLYLYWFEDLVNVPCTPQLRGYETDRLRKIQIQKGWLWASETLVLWISLFQTLTTDLVLFALMLFKWPSVLCQWRQQIQKPIFDQLGRPILMSLFLFPHPPLPGSFEILLIGLTSSLLACLNEVYTIQTWCIYRLELNCLHNWGILAEEV